jgi:uncharacterized protein YecT (DUF1311 family)
MITHPILTSLKFTMLVAAGLGLMKPAAGVECAAPKTGVERAICADPVLMAADDAVNAAYVAALEKLSSEQKTWLEANQARWIMLREGNCAWPPDVALMPGQPAACIREMTARRTIYLSARAESGPGAGSALVPYTVSVPMGEKVCAGEAALHVFAEPKLPGESAFNERVSDLIGPIQAEHGVRDDFDCSWDLHSQITFASPHWIAVSIGIGTFGGSARGNYRKRNILVNIADGSSPAYADIFPVAATPKLVEACIASLIEEKVTRNTRPGNADTPGQIRASMTEDVKQYTETIAEKTEGLGNWGVFADRAEVYFAPYDVGAYAEGDYRCTLPVALLNEASGGRWAIQ